MKIYDQNDRELSAPDLEKGYLRLDRRFLRRHPAVEPVEAVYREVRTFYPETGGTGIDYQMVTPAVPGCAAWDEYEEIQRYIAYTPEELEARSRPTNEERITELEEAIALLLSGVTE